MFVNKLFLLFIIICLSNSVLYTQSIDIKFERIMVEDGLPNGVVHDILQDHRGFMWFGTEDGLIRYDGYNLKCYSQIPLNFTSLSNNCVIAIQQVKGLNKFNLNTQKSSHFDHSVKSIYFICDNNISSVIVARQNMMRIGTVLVRINSISKQITNFVPDSESIELSL